MEKTTVEKNNESSINSKFNNRRERTKKGLYVMNNNDKYRKRRGIPDMKITAWKNSEITESKTDPK